MSNVKCSFLQSFFKNLLLKKKSQILSFICLLIFQSYNEHLNNIFKLTPAAGEILLKDWLLSYNFNFNYASDMSLFFRLVARLSFFLIFYVKLVKYSSSAH